MTDQPHTLRTSSSKQLASKVLDYNSTNISKSQSSFMGPYKNSETTPFSLPAFLGNPKISRILPARAATVITAEGTAVLWLLAEGPS